MFQALVAHPQEALHKWHLIFLLLYCFDKRGIVQNNMKLNEL
jgi:hypothetical protein